MHSEPRDDIEHLDDGKLVLTVAVVGTVGAAAATATEHLAPVLTFVGALIVAVLTAVTTNRRQAIQLVAERKQLELRLAHERALADLADLRSVVEGALGAVDRATRQLESADAPPDSDERAELEAGLHEIAGATSKLRLRLGNGDPLLSKYQELVRAVGLIMKARLEGTEIASHAYVTAYREFAAVAAARIGSHGFGPDAAS